MRLIIVILVTIQVTVVCSQSYLGCYYDNHDRDLDGGSYEHNPPNTIEGCVNFCKSRGNSYAGLQYGYQCFCGNSYGRHGKAENADCNSHCSGNSQQICGGNWKNSVYSTAQATVFPQNYLGCYAKTSQLNGWWFSMTGSAESCKSWCTSQSPGSKYAATHNYWCYCSSTFVFTDHVDDGNCNMECPKNTEEKCGGSNRVSVYRI